MPHTFRARSFPDTGKLREIEAAAYGNMSWEIGLPVYLFEIMETLVKTETPLLRVNPWSSCRIPCMRWPRWELYEVVREGSNPVPCRGIYTLPDVIITENHSYAEAIKRVPRGIICLISALRYHKLTMVNPAEVWVVIPRGEWQPKSDGLRLRIVQFSG